MYLKGTVPILVVPCCSGKACPRNSQRGLIFDRDRPANSQRCPKCVHTYKHRDLGRVNKSSYTVRVPDLRILGAPPERSQENHVQKIQSEHSSRTRHTVRVPDLRILGAPPERSQEQHIQKIQSEKIHRERSTRHEFPTWGSCARRLKDPQEKHIQKIQSENSSPTRHTVRSQPEDLGRVAWKILSRNTHKNFKAKIRRERGTRFEFSTSTRLNSFVKPVTTWLQLNLSE